MCCDGETVAAVKVHRALEQFNPLPDVADAEAAVDGRSTDAIIVDGQEKFLILPVQRNENMTGVAVTDGIGDAFLDHAVDRIFFVLVKPEVLFVGFKGNGHVRNLAHGSDHFRDGLAKTQPAQRVRTQLIDRAADVLNALTADLGEQLQLLFGFFGGDVDQRQTGVQTGCDARQGVSQGVMNLPGQTVSLTGLGHALGHVGKVAELVVGILQLPIKRVDLLDGAELLVDDVDAVDDEENDVQRTEDVVNAEQILLLGGGVVENIIIDPV